MRILAVGAVPFLAGLLPLAPLSSPPDSEPPDAEIVNDEGGAVTITGEVEFTNVFFSGSAAGSVIILEDQAGFVDRDHGFVMSTESQVLAQLEASRTALSYTLSLPNVPAASLRDVDHDDVDEPGVMIYAVAYWTNTWGDAYLEERDLSGGGWSTAYASTRVDPNPSAQGEVIGGTYLVFAPDDEQSFPSGFGDDGLLFTDDDPIVDLPAGYTVVGLDTAPFTFDRSREVTIDLIEGEGSALVDYSDLSYTEAFDAMVELFRTRYAFTELKGIDWDAMAAESRPRFEQADTDGDETGYLLALRDFLWAIPDTHVGFDNLLDFAATGQMFLDDTDGGIGLAIRELDDGRMLANFVLEGGPASAAGIELGAELLALDGRPTAEVVSETMHWSGSWSTTANERLQQLRYATRFPLRTDVEVTYRNPGDAAPTTVTLTTVDERDSFAFSSFNAGLSGAELPVEFELLPSGYLLATIYSFADDDVLQVRLWERMMQMLNAGLANGLIIDMRQNGGGSGFLADQMAAYFFDDPIVLGNTAFYDPSSGEFYSDPDRQGRFIPPAEALRYRGPLAVIVGPSCVSACEFFTYDLTLEGRAEVVGHYPTAGGGGSVEVFRMPLDAYVRFTVGRSVDADGDIHIEGQGIAPTIDVPVTEATLLGEGDALVAAAVKHLDEAVAAAER